MRTYMRTRIPVCDPDILCVVVLDTVPVRRSECGSEAKIYTWSMNKPGETIIKIAMIHNITCTYSVYIITTYALCTESHYRPSEVYAKSPHSPCVKYGLHARLTIGPPQHYYNPKPADRYLSWKSDETGTVNPGRVVRNTGVT